jgi:glycosyltransferase involved in cell wall biosynthesis
MINGPLINIIVPVYNVEKYLARCINSLIGQTYKNIGIILINDGSTDGSTEICDKYALLDHRIKVIHKKNEGVSTARNVGIDESSGEYVGFVDSDDWVEPDMYEKLYNLIIEFNSDISICDYYLERESCNSAKSVVEYNVRIYEGDWPEAFLYQKMGVSSVWNKLFKKDVIKKEFQSLAMSEDALFLLQNFLNAKKIASTNQKLYHYLQRNGSARISSFRPSQLDSLKCADEVYNIVKDKLPQYEVAAKSFMFEYYIGTLSRLFYWNKENDYADVYKCIVNKLNQILIDKKVIKYIPRLKYFFYLLYKKNKKAFRYISRVYYNKVLYSTK